MRPLMNLTHFGIEPNSILVSDDLVIRAAYVCLCFAYVSDPFATR